MEVGPTSPGLYPKGALTVNFN